MRMRYENIREIELDAGGDQAKGVTFICVLDLIDEDGYREEGVPYVARRGGRGLGGAVFAAIEAGLADGSLRQIMPSDRLLMIEEEEA